VACFILRLMAWLDGQRILSCLVCFTATAVTEAIGSRMGLSRAAVTIYTLYVLVLLIIVERREKERRLGVVDKRAICL
jgi:hypothetical protein